MPRSSNVELPFVAVTFAMTVDGKVTTKNYDSVDFTSREDKLHLFRQRALADAVLIGHTSLKRDNVRLSLPAEPFVFLSIARFGTRSNYRRASECHPPYRTEPSECARDSSCTLP